MPELDDKKRALLARLLAKEGLKTIQAQRITTRTSVGPAALSFAQRRLWLLEQMALPGPPAYNMPAAWLIDGPLDTRALTGAFNRLLARHDILRTCIVTIDGEPRQIVDPDATVVIGNDDVSHDDEPLTRLTAMADALAVQPFNLARAPLVRAHVMRLGPERHGLVVVLHHIVADGWSLPILMRELMAAYSDTRHGRPSSLPPLPLQYADYAEWHRAVIESVDGQRHRDFWTRAFTHAPVPADLPTSAPRPSERSFRGAGLRRTFPTTVADALHQLARAEGVSVFMTLLAAVQVLLARLSGQPEVVVGSPMAGRVRPELGDQIGFYVNMLPLRTVVDPAEPFRALLRRVGDATGRALEHEIYPFDQLVHELHLDRDLARSPLFDVVVVVDQAGDVALSFEGLTVTPLERPRVSSKFDLTFHFVESPTTLEVTIEYSTDLFTATRVSHIAEQLDTLLRAIVQQPGTAAGRLPLLSEAVRDATIERSLARDTRAPGPDVVHRFEAAAARRPDSIAVTCGDVSLTYGALNARANRVARQLIAAGITAESRVGVCLERSIDLIVAILGVVKAGGAYVPLDPSYPVERLQYLIADSGMAVVLTAPGTAPDALREWPGNTLLVDDASLAGVRDDNPNLPRWPEHAAYVIYTSGSTGQPKGCIVTHGNVARLLSATDEWFHFGVDDTWTLFHSYAFDFSVWELWGALAFGGRLVVVPYWVSRSPDAFLELLSRERVTILNQTPSAFRELMRADAAAPHPLAVREVIFGGEALDIPSLRPWFAAHGDQQPRLVNMYGITETTVHVTYRPIRAADAAAGSGSVIGIGIPDLSVHLLDAQFEPVPVGVTGEIFVGGAGVCRGYLNRPALTAERFVPDPFSPTPGARLYRSGDLGRWTDTGDLEYLGRRDAQVKIRGFRIETGEIEAALRAAGPVSDAMVIARPHAGGKQLVAFVVADASCDVSSLRTALERTLPDYMVPAHVVRVPARPLTTNGKLDVTALPEPESAAHAAYAPPRTLAETTLCEVWARALGREGVGIDDNYFELGGDSILALRVIADARAQGVALGIRDLYQRRTIRALADALGGEAPPAPPAPTAHQTIARGSLLSEADRARVPADAEDAYPQSRLQAGMFFHSALDPESAVFHDIFSYRLDLPFDEAAWRIAAKALAARHPVLRTSFHWAPYDEPLQVVRPDAHIPVDMYDLRAVPVDQHDALIAHWLEYEKTQAFDPARPPLWRLHVHVRGLRDLQLTAEFHHAILDGWSFARLMSELVEHYLHIVEAPASDANVVAPAAPAGHFREFIALEREAIASAESRAYWTAQITELPDTVLPRLASGPSEPKSIEVPLVDGPAIQARAQQLGVPVKSVCLAVHAAVLAFFTGQAEIVTGLTTNGRPDEVEADAVAGLFLNTVPFRLRTHARTWQDLIANAFATEQELLPHRRFPLADIRTLAGAGSRALYDAGFNFVHFHVYRAISTRVTLSAMTAFEQTDYAFVANFSVDPRDSRLTLRLSYDGGQFSESQMQGIGRAYARALDVAATAPATPACAATLLDDVDMRRAILTRARGPQTPAPRWTLVARLAEVTAATPDAIALRCGDHTWSYRALDEATTRVARHLRAIGVGPGARVGLCMPRSEWLVISLLATMKAGGAYVPIDPAYPEDRIDYLRTDSGAHVILTDSSRAGLDVTHLGAALESSADALPAPHADDLAYVIYTSGSTGRPKGTMVPHAALAHYLDWAVREYRLGPASCALVHSSVSFDATITSLLAPLAAGGTVELLPEAPGVSALADRLTRPGAFSLVKITPAHLDLLRHELGDDGLHATVEAFVIGGEALLDTTLIWWRAAAPAARFLNEYGPTETVVGCALYEDRGQGPPAVPIGRPIDRMRLYVLDPAGRPVPTGITGELFIGGAGVARGYLERPALTAERFLPDPFSPDAGARMYRTGDLARWRDDDVLEYLGRNDCQVKVRGHRVELGEIEAVLTKHPQVREAAVIAHATQGTHELRAFLVVEAAHAPTLDDVRAFVAAQLPEPFVPSRFARLDALPLTPNGKIDRTALLARDTTALDTSRAFVAPVTDAEVLLADIWSEVLHAPGVGVTDDYFASGGDSLKALQVVSRAARAGWRLRVRDIFTYPTIAELARHATRDTAIADQGPVTGDVPLLPIQRWFFSEHTPPYRHFNQSVVLQWCDHVDRAALADAVAALLDHHDGLRARFSPDPSGQWTQTISPPGLRVTIDEAASLESAGAAHATLDPATGRLLAVVVVPGVDDDQVLVAMHHLVIDGVSWRVWLEDLHTAYTQRVHGAAVLLPAKTVSLLGWTRALSAWASSDAARAEYDYWADVAATPASIPVDSTAIAGAPYAAVARLDRDTTAVLFGEAHRAYRTQANDLLITGLALAIEDACDARNVLVTVEGHGRHDGLDLDVSRTMGWFTSRYPMRLDHVDGDLRTRIRQTKGLLRRVPSRGFGYGVLRYVGVPADAAALLCRPAIGFNYLGGFDAGAADGAFRVTDRTAGAPIRLDWTRDHDIDVIATVFDGALEVRVEGTRGRIHTERIDRLAVAFIEQLRAIVAHCIAQPGEPTPDDLAASGLDLRTFDAIVAAHGHVPSTIDDLLPLSPMQEGFLIHALSDESGAYFEQSAYRLRGLVDPVAFEAAWNQLLARYPNLRVNFWHDDLPRPVQAVVRDRRVEFTAEDWRDLDPAAARLALSAFRARERRRRFDLARDPLVRVALFRVGDDTFDAVWSFPHLLLDGWSAGILLNELLTIYAAEVTGTVLVLAEPVPYKRYLEWLEQHDRDASLSFWRDVLDGYDEAVSVPGERRIAHRPYRAVSQTWDISAHDTQALKTLAARLHVTLSTVVQTLWAAVLAAYADRDDVVFGATVSGRPEALSGVERMVGLFINTLPVRVQFGVDESFETIVRRVQSEQLAAHAHAATPLAHIQALGTLGSRLFDHILVFENYPLDQQLRELGSVLRVESSDVFEQVHYDLGLLVSEGRDALQMRFIANGEVYPEARLARVAAHFLELMRTVLDAPAAAVRRHPIVPPAERATLASFNATPDAPPPGETLVSLTTRQALATPDAVAVIDGTSSLTYGELHARAEQWAGALRGRGVGPETLVGVFVHRHADLIIGLLAVLKAGGAYVPLDPNYPADRIAFLLEDAQMALVLTQRSLRADVPRADDEVWCLDEAPPVVAPAAPAMSDPAHLAYIIYTSGSTGTPKGTAISHGAAAALVVWARHTYSPDELRGVLASTSVCFDLSVFEIFVTLALGGTVILAENALALPGLPAADVVTLVNTVPSAMTELVRMGGLPASVTTVNLAGEPLPARLVDALYAIPTVRRVCDLYGPSEDTTYSTFVEREAGGPETIGSPLSHSHTEIYLLNRWLDPVPIGVAGELYLSSDKLCRGYLNRPGLTAERFVPNPFSRASGARMYRTGDLARYREDGRIEFLGRLDHQVKIRGFRVELGEIDATLRRTGWTRDVAVVARHDGASQLVVAYVVPVDGAPTDAATYRDALARTLPDYMVPAHVVFLERLPLTPNGKLDRRALPASSSIVDASLDLPRTALEATLAALWRDALDLDQVGIFDGFFDHGGHSLKAARMIARARQTHGLDVVLRDLFLHPTIAALAAELQSRQQVAVAAIPDVAPAPLYPVSYGQRRLWVLEQLRGNGPSAYHVPAAFRLRGHVDAGALERAFQAVIDRHEVLRTQFVVIDSEPRQQILTTVRFTLDVRDLTPAHDPDAAADNAIRAMAHGPFDLGTAPLLRAALYRTAPDTWVLGVVMHHIATDGWSIPVLMRELVIAYRDARDGRAPDLPARRVQYKEYAAWQRSELDGADHRDHREYWRSRFADLPAALALPTDRPRGPVQTFEGDQIALTLDPALSAGVRALAAAQGATVFMTLVAAVTALLARTAGQRDITVGSPIAGRTHPDLHDQIGYFVNTVPLRLTVSDDDTFASLVARARDVVTSADAHQSYPFDRLVDDLAIVRDLARSPLFDVMVAMDHGDGGAFTLPGIEITPLALEYRISKFDLTVTGRERADECLEVFIEYNTALFDAASVTRLSRRLETLLRAAVRRPLERLARLPGLPADEYTLVVDAHNFTPLAHPSGGSLAAQFEAQARATPDRVALVFGEHQWSYRALDARANGVAAALRAVGVHAPETPVGLLADASDVLIVGLLGILKAGAAYVPLDPAYPRERHLAIVDDAALKVVVSATGQPDLGLPLTRVDVDQAADASAPPDRFDADDTLAYIIYTSGSTGRPKGVAVTHRGVVNLIADCQARAPLSPADAGALWTSATFDVSVYEIFAALLSGGTLHVCAPALRAEPAAYFEWLARTQIASAYIAPFQLAEFRMFLELQPRALRLRRLLVGVEPIDEALLGAIRACVPGLTIINGYGPTETTVCATLYTVPNDVTSRVTPIGIAVANTGVFIVDRDLQPVGIGVVGEIVVAGPGLARGYHGLAAATAAAFVPSPFGPRPGARMYRTGDRGRRLPNGAIVFAGRTDHQVKIRGHRIELGDIERAIEQHPSMAAVAVIARASGPTKTLVAYVTCRAEAPTADTVRAFLAERVPDPMIPSRFVVLDALPLTPNGKIDRRALEQRDADDERTLGVAAGFSVARDAKERALAGIWADVLGVPAVGVDDNYFALGGDSIKAIQIAARAGAHGLSVTIRDVFTHPTVAALARAAGTRVAAPQGPVTGDVPLTAIQRWFFGEHAGPYDHFNQAALLTWRERADAEALHRAITALIDHHDGLRTRFDHADGTWRQHVGTVAELQWLEHDWRDLPQDEAVRLMTAQADAVHTRLDLSAGPLMAAALFRLPDADRILLVVHHLVVDGVSWRVLLEDLDAAYQHAWRGDAIALPAKTHAFRDWARAAVESAARRSSEEIAYWDAVVHAAEPLVLPLSGDRAVVTTSLDTTTTRQLLAAGAARYGLDTSTVLLAALTGPLTTALGRTRLLVHLEGHGREESVAPLDVSRTVGWFTSVYPFLLDAQVGVPGARALDALGRVIDDVQQRTRVVPDHGVGFGLLRYLRGDTGLAASRAAISFNYLGQFDTDGAARSFGFARESSGVPMAPQWRHAHGLDVAAHVNDHRLHVSITFDRATMTAAAAVRLRDDFAESLATAAEWLTQEAHVFEALCTRHALAPADIETVWPLSPMQEGMLFSALYERESAAYFEQLAYRIHGEVDPARFERTWRALLTRHANLRVSIWHTGLTRPIAVVRRHPVVSVYVEDWSASSDDQQRTVLEAYRRADRERSFDLEHDPLMRFGLFRLGPDRWSVVWSYPHLLLDGWSTGRLLEEFLDQYDDAPLPAVAPFSGYLDWLGAQDRGAALARWRERLVGYGEPARIPPGDVSISTTRSRMTAPWPLAAGDAERLRAVASIHGLTMNSLVLALWGVCLGRLNDRTDVVCGSTVSGRPAELPDVERMVGLFINTLPVRVRWTESESFLALAARVQREALAAHADGFVPLADIQASTSARGGLINHLLIFENYPLDQRLHALGGTQRRWMLDEVDVFEATHYPFVLAVLPASERLALRCTYDPSVYAPARIAAVHAQWQALITAVLDNPDRPLGTVDILGDEERMQVANAFARGADAEAGSDTINALLRASLTRTPDAVAVVDGTAHITYRALHARAAALAATLRCAGVTTDSPVGLCLERSIDLVVGMLAIVKAGGAYVPIDPDYPSARKSFMAADAGVRVILTAHGAMGDDEVPGVTRIVVSEADTAPQSNTNDPDTADPPPDALVYVLYTSGSTGQPKGVGITHRALANHMRWMARAYPLAPADRVAQKTPFSFDASVWEFWAPLIEGATLVMAPPRVHQDPRALAEHLRAQRITVVQLVPTLLQALVEEPAFPDTTVQRIFVGGEALSPGLCARVRAQRPDVRVINLYGPTEVTIDSTHDEWRDDRVISIGQPVDGLIAYVFDHRMALAAVDAWGELYLGGVGLARGYLGRPDLTAAAFVPDPVTPTPGARLYRTGDRARWRPDGRLEYGGRLDDQVKVRGFRIELGEVESALRSLGDLVDGAAIVTGQGSELSAFVVLRDGARPVAALKDDLRAAGLAPQMIPTRWLRVTSLPRTTSGKLDRRALLTQPAAVALDAAVTAVAPRTPLEQSVADVWARTLARPSIGIHDNFFDLGGHSLTAARAAAALTTTLAHTVSVREIFTYPTTAELAAYLDAAAWFSGTTTDASSNGYEDETL